MPSRSIIRTGVGPHREPGNRFPAMAAINLLAARAARVQSRRNLSRSLSPKLDHSHSITRFDRSRTGPKSDALLMGLALTHARSWLAKRTDDLSGSDREFIDLSSKREEARQQAELAAARRLAEKQTALVRLQRIALGAAIIALAFVAALAGFSWYQRNEAEDQRRTAEIQRS